MGVIYLDELRELVRQRLMEKIEVSVVLEWENTDLDIFLGQCLRRMSEASPREVIETVSLTANSVEVDISSIEDLIEIDYGEYPVDQDPREYRNVEVFGTRATFVTNRRPSGTEDAYLYCHKLHAITESSSTLTPTMVRILAVGVAAMAAFARSRKQINTSNVGGRMVAREHAGWAKGLQDEFEMGLAGITKQRVTQYLPED